LTSTLVDVDADQGTLTVGEVPPQPSSVFVP